MSDSSDEGEPFKLRDYEEESDEDSLRPNKRRKTQGSSYLRTRGLAFVQKSNQHDDDAEQDGAEQEGNDEEDDEDPDDVRPTMGGLRSGFNIGQFQPAQVEEPSLPDMDESPTPEKASGQGPSAFHAGGKVNKNSFAARMMAKMGHVDGQGLGRTGQGIAAPIQAQKVQAGSGLGFGSKPEPQLKPLKKEKKALPGTPPSGASTPRLKAPPKKKYEVAAIESRGLQVPDALKVIIDATGAENKTLTSLSGYSTPVSDAPKPLSEEEKIQARLKRDLKLFADAWDGQVQESDVLEKELTRSVVETDHFTEQSQLFNDMISSFERVSVDDSQQQRSFDQVIQRLQQIQTRYADYIEPLDLSAIAIATLDKPLQVALLDLDNLLNETGAEIVSQLLTLPNLLQISRTNSSRHRRHTTLLESLLLKHLYPKLRDTFRSWSIYDPIPAKTLIETWYPNILPPWMLYKLCQEIILPRLLEGVRRFKPPHKHSSGKKRDKVPDIHEWIFDWWTLFESLDLESFHQLKVEIKNKVRFDAEAWPKWESLLGRREKKTQPDVVSVPQAESVSTVAVEEITFKDILEQFCTENDLLLRPTGSADSQGRRLLRLQAAEKGVGGMLVYIQGDLVFEASTEEPWVLDEELVDKVRGKK